MNTPTYDVYAYGTIAYSTLHILKQSFPKAEGYGEIVESHPMTGGEALNSALVLSRLGLRVKLDGTWLGQTDGGKFVFETLKAFGVDGSRLTYHREYPGIKEIVFADTDSRTVFGTYQDLFTSRKWNVPQQEDIAAARMVCLDPTFGDESQQVAQYADELDIPYVTVDCAYDHPLTPQAAALIISGEFRSHKYPKVSIGHLFQAYHAHANGLVIFTAGDQKMLCARAGETVKSITPFAIEPVDTAGAGDSFRAGLIYGMLQGWSDERAVRYASALAAMICTRFPGVLDCPKHEEVMAFMDK